METQRQRFSQLNSRFRQQRSAAAAAANYVQPVPPVILPNQSRPLPRQQARIKQTQTTNLLPPASTAVRRPTTSHENHYPHSSSATADQKYITLANLTKILQILQTQVKGSDNETSTVMSSSTTNSAKQRVQQHLQETAMRWWKPVRSSAGTPPAPAPSAIQRYTTTQQSVTQTPSSSTANSRRRRRHQQHQQESDNLPLLTIVSNSTRQFTNRSLNDNASSTNDESEPSVLTTSILSPMKLTRQEPLIMQKPGRRLHTYEHYKSSHPNYVNFSQQRLIHQT